MSARDRAKYVNDLLGGRRPRSFAPDDAEAAEIQAAIELQAARPGADAPRPEFLSDLHRRLAARMDDAQTPAAATGRAGSTRRQVIVGTSAAAAGAVTAVAADRLVINASRGDATAATAAPASTALTPNDGSWRKVASSAEVSDTGMHHFDLGSVIGFVHRVDGQVEAVSGVCTHQGCKLWFDQPDDRLRCPCHRASFAPTGQVLSYQFAVAPRPLPKIPVREHDGVVEVFAPTEPA